MIPKRFNNKNQNYHQQTENEQLRQNIQMTKILPVTQIYH